MTREYDTPPTNPGVRESQLRLDRGPVYASLAGELSTRLRQHGQAADFCDACERVAKDCDSLLAAFASWERLSDDGKRLLVVEWQDTKARARRLGFEIV